MPNQQSAELSAHELARRIKAQARRLGFDLCRITPATTAPHADFFQAWLEAGRSGEMHYLARHLEKRREPARLAEDTAHSQAAQSDTARTQAAHPQATADFESMIVLGVNYHQFDLPLQLRDDPSRGIIASYAWGDDYHEIIRPLLYELDAFIRSQTGRTTRGKCLVDTGPVLERDWAHRAGLGFTGKNCCTIVPRLGSWIFLAVVLIPERPAYDAPPVPSSATAPATVTAEPDAQATLAGLPPAGTYGTWEIPLQAGDGAAESVTSVATQTGASQTGTCGACTRCLDACPTAAFVGPFHLDPQRCISYWTIEARSPVPRALRAQFGNRIFGCDICQEVCPWNLRLPERTPLLDALHAHQDRVAIPLVEGFDPATPYWLDTEAFNARFRKSPVRRAKRAGMLRNVCIALGNWGDPAAIPALTQALADEAPLARVHAAWALGQVMRRHANTPAPAILQAARPQETDVEVAQELAVAVGEQAA